MYSLFLLKRWIEDVLMYPLILIGRLIALAKPFNKEFDVFFFFPFYSIGGAEKVHAQIAQAVGNDRCIIFFTRRSKNNLFYEEFRKSGCLLVDISKHTDNKWLYFFNIIYRGIISGHINRQERKPIVFNPGSKRTFLKLN
jgi:L-malate glycosyltransferase